VSGTAPAEPGASLAAAWPAPSGTRWPSRPGRELEVYGRDGLPVLSADGRQLQGWVTGAGVLRTLARQITASQAQTTQAQPKTG
jgi:hypothetical protein